VWERGGAGKATKVNIALAAGATKSATAISFLSSWCSVAQELMVAVQVLEDDSLVEELDWYILPVLNPDGYQFTHEHVKYR